MGYTLSMKGIIKYCLCVWGIAIAACVLYVGGMGVLILIGHGLHVVITGEAPNYVTTN